jgi:ribonuclease HI
MALRSAIEGLRLLRRPCRVHFLSDSQYLVRGMNDWIQGWKARGWRRKGGPIENLDLWQTLDGEARRHDLQWEWIRGHAGHPRNEYANDLAVRAAKEQSHSGGLVPSRFLEWLEAKREEQEKYLDFFEHLPPP